MERVDVQPFNVLVHGWQTYRGGSAMNQNFEQDFDQIIVRLIGDLLKSGKTVFLFDDYNSRRLNIAALVSCEAPDKMGNFNDGRYIGGKSYVHHDVSIAINPHGKPNDWKNMAKYTSIVFEGLV